MSIGSLILGLLGAVGAALVWRPTGKDAPADWPPRATGTVPDVVPEPAAAGAPRFSVVVPTYNRGPLVAVAIESALAQRTGDFELIVVDDGSTDDTGRRLGRIHDRPLRRLNPPHPAAAAQRAAPRPRLGGRLRRALAELRGLGAAVPAGLGHAVRLSRSAAGGDPGLARRPPSRRAGARRPPHVAAACRAAPRGGRCG